MPFWDDEELGKGGKQEKPKEWHHLVPTEVREKLDMTLAIHRLFTYPRGLLKGEYLDWAKKLANKGIYCTPDLTTICCQFCKLQIDVTNPSSHKVEEFDKGTEKESCEIGDGENIPLPCSELSSCQMRFEAFRLMSLLKYRGEWIVSPYEMAKTGMYKSGRDTEDKCVCYDCHLTLNLWEEGDTARGEHKRYCLSHNLNCKMLEGTADNIPIGKEKEMTKVSHDGVGKAHEGATPFNPSAKKRVPLSDEEMREQLEAFIRFMKIIQMLNKALAEPRKPLEALYQEMRKVHGLYRPRAQVRVVLSTRDESSDDEMEFN